MNYLQLVQALHREAGISGSPTGVASATGETARLFSWINWASREIFLSREDWRFRRGTASVAATSASALSPTTDFGLTDFASWKQATGFYKPTVYRLADGVQTEGALAWIEYDQYRMSFMTGVQTAGKPQAWSVSPSDEFLLGPVPDGDCFVRADYIKNYKDLTADADAPAMPERFHWMIVWRALLEYGGFEAASEVYQRAERNYNNAWTQLVQSQLGQPGFVAASLA